MENLEVKGMRNLNEPELSQTEGGVLGLAIVVVRAGIAAYRTPLGRSIITNGAKWAAGGLGWWSAEQQQQ